jgi:hypothetical protein
MSRASCSALLALWLCQVSLLAQASPLLAERANGLIRDRRDVPLDPLDGIPEEDPNRGKGGKSNGGKSACRLLVTPANDRDVADLRATVALIQRGPKSVACPSDTSPLRLRISIDAKGRISMVERLSGDKRLGDSLARTLTGQLCESTVTTPTKGIAQVAFRRGK